MFYFSLNTQYLQVKQDIYNIYGQDFKHESKNYFDGYHTEKKIWRRAFLKQNDINTNKNDYY